MSLFSARNLDDESYKVIGSVLSHLENALSASKL